MSAIERGQRDRTVPSPACSLDVSPAAKARRATARLTATLKQPGTPWNAETPNLLLADLAWRSPTSSGDQLGQQTWEALILIGYGLDYYEAAAARNELELGTPLPKIEAFDLWSFVHRLSHCAGDKLSPVVQELWSTAREEDPEGEAQHLLKAVYGMLGRTTVFLLIPPPRRPQGT